MQRTARMFRNRAADRSSCATFLHGMHGFDDSLLAKQALPRADSDHWDTALPDELSCQFIAETEHFLYFSEGDKLGGHFGLRFFRFKHREFLFEFFDSLG